MMQEDDIDDEDILFDQSLLRDDGDLYGDDTQDDQAALLVNEERSKPIGKKSRQRILQTICLILAFFGLGLCIAIPGPTLLDLQQMTGTDTEQISRIFTARSIGYLVGSIVGGMLFDRLNQICLISVSLLLSSIATAIVPWCKSLVLLGSLVSFQGVSMGFLDTGGNVLILEIWGRGSGPYMQGLHFAFGMGAFFAPWVAEPFLSQSTNSTNNFTFTYGTNNTFNTSPLLPADLMHRRGVRAVKEGSITPPVLPSSTNWSSTTPKPSKPLVVDGSQLNKDMADGAVLGKKLQKLQKVENNVPAEPPTPSINIKTPDNDTDTLNGTETFIASSQPPTTTTSTTSTTTTTTTTLAPSTTTTRKTTSSTGNAILNVDENNLQDNTTSNSNETSTYDSSLNKLRKNISKVIDGISSVQFAYLAIAIFIMLNSFVFLGVCCSGKMTLRAQKFADLEPDYMVKKESKGFRVQTLILLFIFYFLYVGMEVTYGSLVMVFSVKYLGWSKSHGAMVTSVFWGSFAFGRGLAIPLTKCLTPALMLIGDLILTNLSLLGLVLGLDSNPTMLWFCSGTLGVSMASIFPSGISWAQTYMHLTGKATAVLVVGSALGEMTLPMFTGFLFQAKNPMYLMYVMLGCAVLCIVVYIIMQNLASNKGERYERVSRFPKGARLLGNDDDTDLEMDGIGIEMNHRINSYASEGGKKRVTFNLKTIPETHTNGAASIKPSSNGTVLSKSILKGKTLMVKKD